MNDKKREFGFAPESNLYFPPQHHLRGSLGRFPTGVAVVTYAVKGEEESLRGITINSSPSISMAPPLVLISIGKNARSHDLLLNNNFTVNILSADQELLAREFAGLPGSTEPG